MVGGAVPLTAFVMVSAGMSNVVRVRETPWAHEPNAAECQRSTFLHAEVCDRESCTFIGECGIEVLHIGSDGLLGGDDVRPRALLSGSLFVKQQYRRQGVAQQLLRAAENRVRMWGMPELLLMVKRKNAAARHLYEKMGYECEPQTREHGDQLCMKRNLFSPSVHTLHSMLPQRVVVKR